MTIFRFNPTYIIETAKQVTLVCSVDTGLYSPMGDTNLSGNIEDNYSKFYFKKGDQLSDAFIINNLKKVHAVRLQNSFIPW